MPDESTRNHSIVKVGSEVPMRSIGRPCLARVMRKIIQHISLPLVLFIQSNKAKAGLVVALPI